MALKIDQKARLSAKVLRYVRECSFAFRSASDLNSAFLLIKNTARFHIRNFRLTHPKDVPFKVMLNVGNGSPIVLRPFAGDLFIFYEVLLDQCYYVPDQIIDPHGVKTIVDCGGNIGLSAIYFARRYPQSEIYTIEPDPQNFELLAHNVSSYPNIRPIRAAVVGEERDFVSFTTDQSSWGNSISDVSSGITVPAVTIDQLCERYSISKVDLMKIDIEGGEKELFEFPTFMHKTRFVIMELHEGYTRDQFSKCAAEHGHHIIRGDDGLVISGQQVASDFAL